jgi:hypothetical protein
MGTGGTTVGSASRYLLAVGVWLSAGVPAAQAQLFDSAPLRPPADVPDPTPPPGQSVSPPSNAAPPASAAPAPPPAPALPKGPTLQSLPPAASAPALPPGQALLSLSARFGRDRPLIPAGLHWRIYSTKPSQGPLRPIREDHGPNPNFTLPLGSYVVHVGLGLASAAKTVQLRGGEPLREVFEIPAGGLRIEGKVGDARIPPGQISFDIYKGSQFEPGAKRPIAPAVQTGDVILVPEGTYHIVSNYGDANSLVRSDIRVQSGKLTDATVTHRAAVITLKLVNDWGGEARANTQWSVLTPGGDVIKEMSGAFPRVILADGEYRVVARNDDRTYGRSFRVVTGVDVEVEVLAR